MGKIVKATDRQGNVQYPITIGEAVVINKDGSQTTLAQELLDIKNNLGVTGVKGSAESAYRTGDVTITAENIGLGNVPNESKATMFTSPAFTGTPTAPTAAAGTNTTQVATTAFVKGAIDALDVTDTAVAGKYVSKVTQTDGKITVTRESLPAQTDYSISVTKKATANSGASASYTIAQTASGTSIDIDIPKDMVVSSGAVETKSAAGAWGAAGTYLVLTLANATSDKVYINVGSLIEYVTSGSATTDKIQIAVNASTHKVTASIKAASIEKGDLTTAVQTSLGLADTALQPKDIENKQGTITASGILKGNGSGTITAATAGTDYLAPVTAVTAATADSAATKSKEIICAVTQGTDGQIAVTKSAYTIEKSVPANAVFTDTKAASSLTCTSANYGGSSATTSVQTALNNLSTAVGTKQAALSFDGTYNASTNKVATESTVASALFFDTKISGATEIAVENDDAIFAAVVAALATA